MSVTSIGLAQPAIHDLYSGLHWRLIGPFRGGRALAVTGVPGQPEHFYFGAVDGGVWETDDAGRTWQPIFDDEPIASIGAIAVAPSAPDTLYVGTGEADMRSDIAFGDGVYKSTDGGQHWQHIGLTDTRHIGSIIVDPHDPNNLFVAALGHAYGPNSQRGVFHSTDGGKTWKKTLYKNANTGAIDLAFDPANSKEIYAALWQTRRPPWNVYPSANGPGSGLYKSTDSGKNWKQISGHGFPAHVGRIGIAISPSAPHRVYALIHANKGGGLYRSDDGGKHWRLVNGESRLWRRGWYFGHVAVDPKDPDVLYIPNTALYRSTDAGNHFSPIKGSPGGDDYHSVWIDPQRPRHLIVGSDQGVVVSLNKGKTWSSWYNQPTAQFYHVYTDNRFPYWIYGAQQDTGAAAVPSRTDSEDGITLKNLHGIAAGYENGYIRPSLKNHNIIFGDNNFVSKFFWDSSEDQNIEPTLAFPGHYRHTWTLPLALSPLTHALYFANQRVFRTRDGGRHWSHMSSDLTRKQPPVPSNVGSLTAKQSAVKGPRRGVIYTIAPSLVKKSEVWAGTDDGLIWITHDDGRHWRKVTPQGMTPWSKVSLIEASPYDADTAYAAVDRHRIEDDRPYIYRTTNGGKSWHLIVNGIPDNDFVRVVREDPKHKGLLYAGTEKGIFISFDDGNRWQPLQLNLPVTSIRDITIHDNDLIVATHGRAFWALDDITSLRQIAANATRSTRLFKPETAHLLRPAAFINTPFPKDEPAAKNPPNGAIIDYYLKTKPSQPVMLKILDDQGQLVRRFSSADEPIQVDQSKTNILPYWRERIAPPARLSAASGMHRFVWDLRYPLPKALKQAPSDYEYAYGNAGLWTPPGRYTVKLTVNGHTQTQSLIVKSDPRMHVSRQTLLTQFKLARKIESTRVRISANLKKAEHLHNALAARGKHVKNKQLAAAIDSLKHKVQSITGREPPAFNAIGVPPASLKSLRYLAGSLKELETAIESAETAPTPDVRTGLKKRTRVLNMTLKQWKALLQSDLPKLNQQLKQADLKPIAVQLKT